MKSVFVLLFNHRQTERERKYPTKEDEVDGTIIMDLMLEWITK